MMLQQMSIQVKESCLSACPALTHTEPILNHCRCAQFMGLWKQIDGELFALGFFFVTQCLTSYAHWQI